MLYPLVSNMPQEEVDQFPSCWYGRPLSKLRLKELPSRIKPDIYNEIIEATALDQKTPEQAITELETLRDGTLSLRLMFLPAVLGALKQSDNPTAQGLLGVS